MKHLLFTLIVVTLISCTSSEKKQVEVVPNEQIIDTTNIDSNEKIIAKERNIAVINLDTDYYLSAIRNTKDTISDYNKLKLREFTYLKTGQTQFKYYIITELKFNNGFKSYLIAADFESEQSCWIANYSDTNDLLSSYEVYYDNAEGAWLTTASIDQQNKSILVTTYDMYRDPEEKHISLRIDEKGKILEQ